MGVDTLADQWSQKMVCRDQANVVSSAIKIIESYDGLVYCKLTSYFN